MLTSTFFDLAHEHWKRAAAYQKVLYVLGLVSITSGMFHIAVWLIAGGPLTGPVSWRKPIVFGFSGGLTAITAGLILSLLPRRPILGWLLALGIGGGFFVDTVLITMQQWRGVPSHFNLGTTFDASVFAITGMGVMPVEVGVLVLAIWTFLSLKKVPPSLAWAIRLGMTLLVVSQVFGNLIIQNGFTKLFDPATGAFQMERIATAAIFGEAGSMKIPHALTLHGVQILPVLALLLGFSGWEESRRLRLVLIAALGYVGVVVVSAGQTFRGLAPFDLSLPALLALVVSATVVAAAYLRALVAAEGVAASSAG